MIRSSNVILACLLLVLCCILPAYADGPQDNAADNVRQVPPPGIEIKEEHRLELQDRLKITAGKIQELRNQKHKFVDRYLPDVEVLYRAVDQALSYQEMFQPGDVQNAAELLNMADDRAAQLKDKKADWTKKAGLVIRGFRSSLDGTVQPYGLEIAEDYDFEHPTPVRCDIWFHGRGETSMELQFLIQHHKRAGEFPPKSGMVLHPYGRYSNGFKFAGEVDTLEALAHVQENYRIDADRISVRGFSMGGAATWLFAVHHTDKWFAANPGAGFSETPEFLKIFQGEKLNPPWYEEKLWRLHDCNLWVENLRQVPTVAYSGEIDKQKQAADLMEAAAKQYNIDLMHIIGPQTAHKIHPVSNQIIREKMDSLAQRGRVRFPHKLHLTTYTLKYNRMHWVTVHGIKEHWEKSTIDASIIEPGTATHAIEIKAEGVTDFSIDFPSGFSPFDVQQPIHVVINDQKLPEARTKSDWSLSGRYTLVDGKWSQHQSVASTQVVKKHNLQGPIDDALMSPFLFVRPTNTATNPELQAWVDAELARAIKEWRKQMRGDVRIKNDADLTPEDIAAYNLILWGTPESNSLIKKVAPQLSINWNESGIHAGDQNFAPENHILAVIAPNPLNTDKYVVFNSSLTYREYDYLNNARQTPKLPDWAVIDVNTKPNARWPGKVVAADFFNEQWELKPAHKN
jgi:pimeloyl-ACP methyl ester carboxylesterase